MANVIVNNRTYNGVTQVELLKSGGGNQLFPIPSGTSPQITTNGTHDVSGYQYALVNVSGGSGSSARIATGSFLLPGYDFVDIETSDAQGAFAPDIIIINHGQTFVENGISMSIPWVINFVNSVSASHLMFSMVGTSSNSSYVGAHGSKLNSNNGFEIYQSFRMTASGTKSEWYDQNCTYTAIKYT